VDAAGERLGELLRIDHAPAHDLLVVRLTDGRTGLVPFVREIVPEVDVRGGRIVITPPEGLFDL
jgi:16S rRNA processing protein RimM